MSNTKAGITKTGLVRLAADPPSRLRGARLGFLCNPAAVNHDFVPAWRVLQQALPGQIRALFGPQHGFFADKQDNMIESGHARHPELGVPIYSLYSETRRPTREMLQGLDVMLVDLVDVGCRVYTFFSTLTACMEECAAQGVAMMVLDRPNPIGRDAEGPILPSELMSFVGTHDIPLKHGLTLGELARLVAAERGLDLDLAVVACQGWDGRVFAGTGLPWVLPSPNMPTPQTALVYPGQVLLEGTSLSEGRGTTRPFEMFGAPGLAPEALAEAPDPEALAGCVVRPLFFEPTFHKFAGQTCGGLQIHVTDPGSFRPLRLTLDILATLSRLQPGLWEPRQPPYEYETERRPLDILLGDPKAVEMLLAGAHWREIEERWQDGLAQWGKRIAPHLLYPA